MTDALPNLQLLQASADPDNDSEFRILVDGKSIKYITIGAGIYDCDDMCFGPSLVSLLPPLPPGDWNTGRISRHAATGEAHFVTVSNEPLPGITTTWHATHIDHLELTMEDKLRSNVYLATCPRFSSAIVVKFARFPWEISQLETETAAYEWIEGQQIAPNFLGHLTEEGRVIGFVMSHIPNCRHASPEDLQQCVAWCYLSCINWGSSMGTPISTTFSFTTGEPRSLTLKMRRGQIVPTNWMRSLVN